MSNASIIDHIVDAVLGPSIAPRTPSAASAHVEACNTHLVDTLAARQRPIAERAFAAPPPPSPGQRS
jgi:hypothetical protein